VLISDGGGKEYRARPFSMAPIEKRQWAQTEIEEIAFKHNGKIFCCEDS